MRVKMSRTCIVRDERDGSSTRYEGGCEFEVTAETAALFPVEAWSVKPPAESEAKPPAESEAEAKPPVESPAKPQSPPFPARRGRRVEPAVGIENPSPEKGKE